MAGKPVKIHPAALAELKSALTWYSEKSSATASKFAAELDRAVQLVSGAPKTWPTGEHGTRKFVLQHFPFAIIYREKGSAVEILAVAHGHRRPSYWKNR